MYYKCFFYNYTHYYDNLFRVKKQIAQLKKNNRNKYTDLLRLFSSPDRAIYMMRIYLLINF